MIRFQRILKQQLLGYMRLLNKYLKEVNQMNKIANLPKEQRRELFTQSALKMNTTNAITKKIFGLFGYQIKFLQIQD